MTESTPTPPAVTIDESTSFGARAAQRLREEVVVWLSTVSPAGAPNPNPVWFLWDGASTVRVWSLPDAARVRHLEANPRVSLHFDSDGKGSNIVVLAGIATLEADAPRIDAVPEYVQKYGQLIEAMKLTPESFGAQYSLPITITLTRLRGY